MSSFVSFLVSSFVSVFVFSVASVAQFLSCSISHVEFRLTRQGCRNSGDDLQLDVINGDRDRQNKIVRECSLAM